MQEETSRSRYLVRRLEPSDAESLFAAVRASLPGLVDWMPWCKLDYAIEDAEAWIRFTQACWEGDVLFFVCGAVSESVLVSFSVVRG